MPAGASPSWTAHATRREPIDGACGRACAVGTATAFGYPSASAPAGGTNGVGDGEMTSVEGRDGDVAEAVAPGRRLSGTSVLVVDDSRTVRRSARSCLEAEGCRVDTAADGFEALAAIVRLRPDVVVADIVMPRLDGYQVCALVRNNAEFADLPVLLLSSRDGLFDRARGRVVGATDHLAKPFDGPALVGAVAAHVASARHGAPDGARRDRQGDVRDDG